MSCEPNLVNVKAFLKICSLRLMYHDGPYAQQLSKNSLPSYVS
jgi:hypothetical protein